MAKNRCATSTTKINGNKNEDHSHFHQNETHVFRLRLSSRRSRTKQSSVCPICGGGSPVRKPALCMLAPSLGGDHDYVYSFSLMYYTRGLKVENAGTRRDCMHSTVYKPLRQTRGMAPPTLGIEKRQGDIRWTSRMFLCIGKYTDLPMKMHSSLPRRLRRRSEICQYTFAYSNPSEKVLSSWCDRGLGDIILRHLFPIVTPVFCVHHCLLAGSLPLFIYKLRNSEVLDMSFDLLPAQTAGERTPAASI